MSSLINTLDFRFNKFVTSVAGLVAIDESLLNQLFKEAGNDEKVTSLLNLILKTIKVLKVQLEDGELPFLKDIVGESLLKFYGNTLEEVSQLEFNQSETKDFNPPSIPPISDNKILREIFSINIGSRGRTLSAGPIENLANNSNNNNNNNTNTLISTENSWKSSNNQLKTTLKSSDSNAPSPLRASAFVLSLTTELLIKCFPNTSQAQLILAREIIINNQTISEWASIYSFPSKIKFPHSNLANSLQNTLKENLYHEYVSAVFYAYVDVLLTNSKNSKMKFAALSLWLCKLIYKKIDTLPRNLEPVSLQKMFNQINFPSTFFALATQKTPSVKLISLPSEMKLKTSLNSILSVKPNLNGSANPTLNEPSNLDSNAKTNSLPETQSQSQSQSQIQTNGSCPPESGKMIKLNTQNTPPPTGMLNGAIIKAESHLDNTFTPSPTQDSAADGNSYSVQLELGFDEVIPKASRSLLFTALHSPTLDIPAYNPLSFFKNKHKIISERFYQLADSLKGDNHLMFLTLHNEVIALGIASKKQDAARDAAYRVYKDKLALDYVKRQILLNSVNPSRRNEFKQPLDLILKSDIRNAISANDVNQTYNSTNVDVSSYFEVNVKNLGPNAPYIGPTWHLLNLREKEVDNYDYAIIKNVNNVQRVIVSKDTPIPDPEPSPFPLSTSSPLLALEFISPPVTTAPSSALVLKSPELPQTIQSSPPRETIELKPSLLKEEATAVDSSSNMETIAPAEIFEEKNIQEKDDEANQPLVKTEENTPETDSQSLIIADAVPSIISNSQDSTIQTDFITAGKAARDRNNEQEPALKDPSTASKEEIQSMLDSEINKMAKNDLYRLLCLHNPNATPPLYVKKIPESGNLASFGLIIVEIFVENIRMGIGIAKSIKEAGQRAAMNALKNPLLRPYITPQAVIKPAKASNYSNAKQKSLEWPYSKNEKYDGQEKDGKNKKYGKYEDSYEEDEYEDYDDFEDYRSDVNKDYDNSNYSDKDYNENHYNNTRRNYSFDKNHKYNDDLKIFDGEEPEKEMSEDKPSQNQRTGHSYRSENGRFSRNKRPSLKGEKDSAVDIFKFDNGDFKGSKSSSTKDTLDGAVADFTDYSEIDRILKNPIPKPDLSSLDLPPLNISSSSMIKSRSDKDSQTPNLKRKVSGTKGTVETKVKEKSINIFENNSTPIVKIKEEEIDDKKIFKKKRVRFA